MRLKCGACGPQTVKAKPLRAEYAGRVVGSLALPSGPHQPGAFRPVTANPRSSALA